VSASVNLPLHHKV